MTGYEVTVIFDALLDDGDIAKLTEKVKGIVSGQKGEVKDEIDWGRKKLAYPINKKNYGYYKVLFILGNGETIAELNRQCSYDTSIFKCYVVKTDDLETAKSAFQRLIQDPVINANLYTQFITKEN